MSNSVKDAFDKASRGTLIESKQIAKQIDDVFTKLIFSKVFSEV